MGTTIGTILISYDVDRLNPEVKAGLIKLGYSDRWNYVNDNKIYLLPNTTLWHSSKSSDQGLVDMQSVCRSLGAKLEKAVSVKATDFVGI
ncbi:hypothetical protein KHA90_24385 [Flavobacterium psychroterrae]|uniref:Uncharacterized protein n=1 Tax=Flavobacterium psychroterrae TaxID=2133767 RepID=A0ABS5PIL3_9FLAO|nr:hypothetical protein [Flavobacterium psychroterrae]MBS7234144.1 hypothetical protein [Flavobacterium psychroterrae]